MAESYVRQSAFANGDVIDASLFNAEFDQLEEAFGETSGHNHDGTVAGGAPVPFIQKGTSGIYVDTSNPLVHKITVKINNVVVTEFTESSIASTSTIKHTPTSTGVPVDLDDYLEGLEVAVGDAATDAAIASEAADRAEAAAMVLGIPVVLADGATYNILPTMVQVDIVCLGNATINLPATLTTGYRYSIRVTSQATSEKRAVIMNPIFNIVGDVRTLGPGDNLELKPKELVLLDVINTTTMEIL